MKVQLQWVTPDAEYQMAYCARVSSIKNQDSKEFKRLFNYCLRNGHWSIFQMASMCLSIETSLAVATQMMRHWSLQIQEPLDIQQLSQRYTNPLEQGLDFQPIELRKKAEKNRQSSEEPLSGPEGIIGDLAVLDALAAIRQYAEILQKQGVADECIRMIFPQATTTRFFVSGSCRSWIHYFDQRISHHAQKEHRELAIEIEKIFSFLFPTVYEILQEMKNDAGN